MYELNGVRVVHEIMGMLDSLLLRFMCNAFLKNGGLSIGEIKTLRTRRVEYFAVIKHVPRVECRLGHCSSASCYIMLCRGMPSASRASTRGSGSNRHVPSVTRRFGISQKR